MYTSEDIKNLIEEARSIYARELSSSLRSIELVWQIEQEKVALYLGLSIENLCGCIGLTVNQYWKRVQIGRTLSFFPQFKPLLAEGKIKPSNIAAIAGKITQANVDIFLEKMPGMTKREVEYLSSSLTFDGEIQEVEPTVELKVRLGKSTAEKIDRAREVLAAAGKVPSTSEVLDQALEILLEKKDPVKKAERAMKRKAAVGSSTAPGQKTLLDDEGEDKNGEKSQTRTPSPAPGQRARPSIPAELKHRVYLKYGGRCAHVHRDGSRCQEKMMLELDHVTMWCRGGTHSLENLRLLCRRHNQEAAGVALGWEIVENRRSPY